MPPILQAARALAASRVLFGAGLVLAPRAMASVWVGRRRASGAEAAVLGRALGARDLALGAATLRALTDGEPTAASAALAASAACDGVDLAATLAARHHLPALPAAFTALAAGGSAAIGLAALAARARASADAPAPEMRVVR